MPKRKKPDLDDDEYQQDGSPEASEDDGGDEDEEFTVDETKPTAKPRKRPPKKPTLAMKNQWRDLVSSRTHDTSARMTENGGYAHTLDSKMKISKANKGNTPWNKGKQRSAADKAKIGAGVRARNRAILLEKLKKIGMSEDEWHEQKKQLKYLRERVRKAKKAKDEKLLAKHQESLNSALAVQEKVNSQSSQIEIDLKTKKKPLKPKKSKEKEATREEMPALPSLHAAKEATREEMPALPAPHAAKEPEKETPAPPVKTPAGGDPPIGVSKMQPTSPTKKRTPAKPKDDAIPKLKKADPLPPKTKRNVAIPAKAKTVEKSFVNFNSRLQNGKPPKRRRSSASQRSSLPKTLGGVNITDIFAKDVTFAEHEFESSELENPYEICPSGGPGGLICCAHCTKTYSSFLTSTAKDIEQQKTRKVNKEVSELLGFLAGAKTKLDEKLRDAKQRTKVGSLHRPRKGKASKAQSVDTENQQNEPAAPSNMPQLAAFQPIEEEQTTEVEARKGAAVAAVQLEDLREPEPESPSVFQSMVVDDSSNVDFSMKALPETEATTATKPVEEEHNSVAIVAV